MNAEQTPDPAIRVNFNPQARPDETRRSRAKSIASATFFSARRCAITTGVSSGSTNGSRTKQPKRAAKCRSESKAWKISSRREVQSLTNRLNVEQSDRGSAIEKLAHDLAETARALEGKIKNLDEHTARELHNLREQLLEQSKALSSEIEEKHDQMKAGPEPRGGADPQRHDRARIARRDAERSRAPFEERVPRARRLTTAADAPIPWGRGRGVRGTPAAPAQPRTPANSTSCASRSRTRSAVRRMSPRSSRRR